MASPHVFTATGSTEEDLTAKRLRTIEDNQKRLVELGLDGLASTARPFGYSQ